MGCFRYDDVATVSYWGIDVRRPIPYVPLRAGRFGLALLIGLIPLVLGIVAVYRAASADLQDDASRVARLEQMHIDMMLDETAAIADSLLAHVGRPCNEVGYALRKAVVIARHARSFNLFSQGYVYCSSLAGAIHLDFQIDQFVERTLMLAPGTYITPSDPVLYLARSKGDASVWAVMYGEDLRDALSGHAATLSLIVGPHWMDSQGRVHDGIPAAYREAETVAVSEKYPFRVQAGFPDGSIARIMRERYISVLALLFCMSSLVGLLVYRLAGETLPPTAEIERAIRAKEFEAWLQPVVGAADGVWVGAEMLARWRHPQEGLIRPDFFIPITEESGQIVEITRQQMKQVQLALRQHLRGYDQTFYIGVNVAAVQCRDRQLVSDCEQFLSAFAPGQVTLQLELTERHEIGLDETTRAVFDELNKIGVRLAIDDFGTGHASMAYLQQFRVDVLKIDKSFISLIGSDALTCHLIDTVVELATRLGLTVIAEGVETEAQRKYLMERGVTYLQGYLFAPPMPLNEFVERLPLGRSATRQNSVITDGI